MNPLHILCAVLIINGVVILLGWLHGKGKAEYFCTKCLSNFYAYPGDYCLQCPECLAVYR